MLRLDTSGFHSPRLPQSRWTVPAGFAASFTAHAAIIAGIVWLVARTWGAAAPLAIAPSVTDRPREMFHLVFVARGPIPEAAAHGGGGGGNRQPGPIRRAQGIGSDAMTLRVAKPIEMAATPLDSPSLPGVLLDAKPLASGWFDQIGVPGGTVSGGLSTGSGSGGGVGTGTGTGIGSGNGPGIGPGSGGGVGGGVYRPGSGVSPPRVVHQVKPTYTSSALSERIQGTVILELVVTRDGHPTRIQVVRSLDPLGLDERAVTAVSEWRFEPGRLAGMPVDVLVTVALDFWIH